MIILDTSFIISFEVITDQNHERATRIMEEIENGKFGEPVISDYIFDEVLTVSFGKTKDLEKSVLIGNKIMSSLSILWLNEKIFEKTWELFKSQKDTSLSFTDCSILAVMKSSGIKNIATFDEDFKKVKDINVVS